MASEVEAKTLPSEMEQNQPEPDTATASLEESSEGSADLNVERLLSRIRSEAMYELRKLRHQHRPVSEFCSKQQLELFFSQQNRRPQPTRNSRAAQNHEGQATGGEGAGLVAQHARRFASEPQAADPQSLMPEGIRLEVRGLFERQRVSHVLQNPEIQQRLETALRESTARQQRRHQRRAGRSRPRDQEPENGRSVGLVAAIRRGRLRQGTGRRPHARSPAHPRRAASQPSQNRHYPPPPRRDQSRIVEQVRQSPTLNTLNPAERDRVVAEIGHLVQQQFVSTALSGEFRGVLELHIQERADRLTEGLTDEEYFQATLSRRQARSASSAAAHSHSENYESDDVSAASLCELREEMAQMKAQLQELKQIMRVSFDLQLDIQRSIRQEVSAALAAFSASAVGATGGHQQQPAVTLQSDSEPRPIDSGNCVICSEAAIDSVVYRCGHLCVCMACGLELKAQGLKCPICRAPITDIVRAYTSML